MRNTENQNNPSNAQHLALKLHEWAQTLKEWDFKQQISTLDEMENAYLNSNLADIVEDRREVIFNKSLLKRFLNAINEFNDDAFSGLPTLNISTCTETK